MRLRLLKRIISTCWKRELRFTSIHRDSAMQNSASVMVRLPLSVPPIWITGAFTDSNGTINGTFETDSDAQRELLNQFSNVMEDDGVNTNVYPAKQTKQDYMMSRRETNIVGETAVWEHFPVIVESLQTDKPLDGEQNFNFNYKVDGGNHPGMIYYKVIEEPAA